MTVFRPVPYAGCATLVIGAIGPASATVADLRSAAQANTNLLYQYTFEGDSTQRLLDSGNAGEARHLTEEAGRNGGNTANLAFPQGFDPTTTAFRPEWISETQGAALRANDDSNTADDDLLIPGALTVEFLFTVDSASPNYSEPLEDDYNHAVNTRIWPLRRGYYLMQDPDGNLITNIGRRFSSLNQRTIVDAAAINPGNWYYYAITLEAADFDNVDAIPDTDPGAVSTGSDTTVNAYIADLTAGDTVLTQVITDEVFAGGFAGPKNSVSSGNIGIGMFEESEENSPGGGDKQFWDGSLDEVSLYGEALSAVQLQAQLDALLSVGNGVITGDYDTSGQVEQGDLDIVLQNWGTDTFTGDEDALVGGGPFDGTVDQNELDGVLQNWGSTSAPNFAGSNVPEPVSVALLGVSGLMLCRRRATA